MRLTLIKATDMYSLQDYSPTKIKNIQHQYRKQAAVESKDKTTLHSVLSLSKDERGHAKLVFKAASNLPFDQPKSLNHAALDARQQRKEKQVAIGEKLFQADSGKIGSQYVLQAQDPNVLHKVCSEPKNEEKSTFAMEQLKRIGFNPLHGKSGQQDSNIKSFAKVERITNKKCDLTSVPSAIRQDFHDQSKSSPKVVDEDETEDEEEEGNDDDDELDIVMPS